MSAGYQDHFPAEGAIPLGKAKSIGKQTENEGFNEGSLSCQA